METLGTLAEQVTAAVMVPLGKYAMVPGRLVHTNEVLVLLGENYFAMRSASQARAIAQRRLQWVDNTLATLARQRAELTARRSLQRQYADEHIVEIREPLDDNHPLAAPAQACAPAPAPAPKHTAASTHAAARTVATTPSHTLVASGESGGGAVTASGGGQKSKKNTRKRAARHEPPAAPADSAPVHAGSTPPASSQLRTPAQLGAPQRSPWGAAANMFVKGEVV